MWRANTFTQGGFFMKNKTIPIFYACDEPFIKYAAVSLKSLLANADKTRFYKIHVLITDVSDSTKEKFFALGTPNAEISFDDVSGYLGRLSARLPLRDYYSKTTYFRLFIADMFPRYDKAIYIDADTVVTGDISKLYDTDLKDNLVGAVSERVMAEEKVFGDYVERVVGIDRYAYFNAGVLLINCKAFRQKNILGGFSSLLNFYNFAVTQDEDYLNVLCKDKVKLLDPKWNAEIFNGIPVTESEVAIFHYIMTSKPWHYPDCPFGGYFFKYAELTEFYGEIKAVADGYTDEQRINDEQCGINLKKLAESEISRGDGYLKKLRKHQDEGRVKVLEKINALEADGVFDVDVEDDPPTKPLPDGVDFAYEKLSSKIKSKTAFAVARWYLNSILRTKKLIVRDIVGVENLRSVNGGAIITCNHFNAFDSFIMQMVYEKCDVKRHKFYRIIREGNYTSFGGFYGFLMRNCNTLPLSSDYKNMRKMTEAVGKILDDKGFILVYAEQSMWWNYRKPKPLKKGAFSLAAANNVPVIPCFITMRDGDVIGADGFPVQEYTVHICKPIYPDPSLTRGENAARMKDLNELYWKDCYQSAYGIPLRFNCEDKNGELVIVGG